MEKIIIISEPWNFSSSEGENKLKVREICKEKEYLVYECLSQYLNMSNYLLLQERDKKGNYNIYEISDYSKISIDELKFTMIGKFK